MEGERGKQHHVTRCKCRRPLLSTSSSAQKGESANHKTLTSSASRKSGDTPKVAAMLASVTLL